MSTMNYFLYLRKQLHFRVFTWQQKTEIFIKQNIYGQKKMKLL